MSGLTEEEKAMIQSVMMKAQEFEKGAPSTMPSPKPSQTSTSQQGSHRPTQSQPQQQPQRIQGGIESGYQQKGGVNQMTSGQRVPGINQSISQPQPQQQQQPQHSSDPNFELNHFQQQQKQPQHRHQVPQQPSQSQSINQQIRPITSSSQSQNQQQQQHQQSHHQMHQQQPYQSQQNLPSQQNHSVNHQQQQGLQYQNGPDLDQMKSNQQQQDYFQQQQQYPQQQQQQQSQPQPPLSNENLPNQQQPSDNSMISSQQTQQGLIQNQLPLMRNQANQDQNINYQQQQQQQQQQLGRQQPQIPQGQQQQSFTGMNQPHLQQHHQPQQLQQNPPNQGNQQQLMQQSQLTQENGFSFNNQNLQDFSQPKMNQTQSQQPNHSIGDNNRFNNNNLFNNNNINNQQVLNSEGSIMFDNMPNERLDEQITDPYGSSLKADELHSNHTLIQGNNYQTNLSSMDGNNIYQDSGSNCFRNDPNNNETNNTTNSNNINNNLNQFNQRLNDQFGNQQQFNSGFPKQQQQSTHQHILPNTQLQGQQSMQHKQQQNAPNSNQQAFPREPDQFSHSQSQLPQMSQKGPLQPLGSLQLTREPQLETQPQQQLQQLTHQQGPGMAPKPFLDPASLFNQENVEPNLQSTSGSQNPIIQASSSTTITPTGTSFRQLPNQVDIMAQNQLKTTNLQYQQQQQHQHPQQQQQPIHQQLTNQQQQFNQPQLYQPTNSYQSNQFDSNSFMRPNENQMKRDFREYQGSDGNQVNQQQMASMGIKSLTGPTGSTYQTEQSIEGNFSDVNRFNQPFQSTNNPSISNVNRSLVGPKSQGKPSDTNSPTLTGLIPRTVPLQSVRDQLSSSSVSTGSTSSLVSSSSPATSIVSNQHHLQQQQHQQQQQHSQHQTQSQQHVNHPNQSINCIPVSSSTNLSTSNSSSNKPKSSMNLLTQGNSLAYGSNINSMGSLELTNHHLINRGNSINSNDSNNNNDSHSNINSSVNNDNNSYSQQQIHAQQMKRMEIGDCWSPVSELSPIQDVSPSIEQAEQRSMQQHQQSLASVNNTNLVKLNDEYGNGLHRVTSGTISGMLADFNKQMEALSTVSPTDDRSKVQQQHSNRRSSLSRLQLGSSSSANGSIESRSRSGSLSVIGHEPLSYSTLASTAATTTTSSRPSTSASETANLIKSLQTSLLSSSSSTAPSSTTTTVTSAISSTTSSATSSTSTNKLPSKSNLSTDIGSNVLTSKPDATTLNESSILVTPGNLQLLAQSLPPAQLAIPRTVTHQVELAVSPVVEQTLQQQQMLIQQQQQLIMLQKELFQQQQEQCQKQEQLQKEQEKKKAKQQSTTIQSQSSQGQAQSQQQQQQQQQISSSSSGQQTNQMTSSSHSGHHTSDHHVTATSSATSTTASSTASSSVVTSAHRHSQFSGPSSSAPATPNRKDRRRLPQPTIEEIQGAVQAISNQSTSSSIYSHGSSLTANKTSTGASQHFGARPISPLIPRKNQIIGVPIIPPMSRSRPTQASTVLTMATPTVVSSSIATTSSLLDPRHGLAASSLGMIRGISPLSMLDETQSEAGGLKNKRRLPLVPLDEEPVTAAAVSRKLIKERLMGKASGGAGNLSCKSVQLLRSASSLDHTPNTGMGLGPFNKDGPGFSGLPLRSRPHSGPISPFSSLSDIANLINSSASGLAGLDLHRPQTPINTLRSSMTGGAGPNGPSEFQTSLANYLGINVSGGANMPSGPASVFGLSHKSPFVTSSLPPSSPMTSPLGGGLGLGSGGGYIKSLKSQLKDELKSVVDERLRLLEGREPREKQDLYRRSETDLQALYDLGSIEMDALHSRRGLLNRRRPLGGLRRGDTLDPRALGTYSSLLQEPNMMGNRFSAPGLAPELFKSYEYEFLDPGASAYPGLLPTSSLATGRSPFGGPSSNFRRPVSSLGVLGSGLNSTDMAYGLRDRLTNGELDPGLRESFIPNFMDTGGVEGARLLGMGAGHNRFRRRSEGSIDESLLHYDPYNSMNISGVRGYDDLRTNVNAAGATAGGHTGYRARPLLGSIGPAHSWHPSPYGSEDEDDKMTREEKASRVKAEIARRRAQLMETGRAVADDLGGGGKLHVGPSGHHPSYYSRDQTQQYNSSAYRRQIGARGNGPMAGEDYSPSGYMDDYYTSGNRCMHGSPTHVRRSRMTRDGLYSRSLDTGYEDYTGAPLHHHPDQQQHQQAYDEYGYYNRGNGINRPVTTDYQPNYNGPNYVANHNLPSQGQSLPANKRPKYPFPVKRILLIRDPKERAHGGSSSKPGNCYGLRLIGGQEIPGTDQVGTFVEKTITGGAVDSLGEIREGDQVLEWNGLPLTGLSNEEVQRLVSASNNAEEVELVIRRDFNLFDVRYDYNSYSQTAPTDGDYYVNNRGQMSQGIAAGTAEGDQYYQSP
ncbi:homeobox protein 5-like isoform X2 [Tetranychus urticae]|uniref:homeobox protein 5-like isoform X2 n=1 Tax=Tetranychus urticae TaxID=32264 RepID=UPI00077BBEDE|nr:homeobox protein 5-like isoform X2 [Tetranychus urticae]